MHAALWHSFSEAGRNRLFPGTGPRFENLDRPQQSDFYSAARSYTMPENTRR